MKAIYRERVMLKEQGKLTRSIYEGPRVISDRLSCIPGLQKMMIRYGLEWITHILGGYSPTIGRKLYASYATII